MDVDFDCAMPHHLSAPKHMELQPEDLANEVHDALLAKQAEVMKLRQLVPFPERTTLVEWIYTMGHHFRLDGVTMSTAVYYLDGANSKLEIPKSGLRLAALACLMMAAKWEEKEIDIPTLRELLSQCPGVYTKRELRSMEMIIFKAYHWNVTPLVAHSFLQYYVRAATTAEDMIEGVPAGNRVCETELHSYAEYFIEVADKDASMLRFPPSLVAAAAVAAARACVGLTPTWPNSLARLSRFSFTDGRDIFVEFCRVYDSAARKDGRTCSPTVVAEFARLSPCASPVHFPQRTWDMVPFGDRSHSPASPMCASSSDDAVPMCGVEESAIDAACASPVRFGSGPGKSIFAALAKSSFHAATGFFGHTYAAQNHHQMLKAVGDHYQHVQQQQQQPQQHQQPSKPHPLMHMASALNTDSFI